MTASVPWPRASGENVRISQTQIGSAIGRRTKGGKRPGVSARAQSADRLRAHKNTRVPRPTHAPAAAPRNAHLTVLISRAACSVYHRLSSERRGGSSRDAEPRNRATKPRTTAGSRGRRRAHERRPRDPAVVRGFVARLRGSASRDEPPRLSDESRWYTEHAALLISTVKWAFLGAAAGACVGLGTRVFLWALSRSADWARALTPGRFPPFVLLPIALPICVWLIRTFSPDARGHGTEAVIAAVHQRSGRVDWLVAPVKLAATVVTLAFGGSVGKEGPAAQIGAALTSLFADILRLRDEDRRRLVICGISAGFAAVFGTPVSGALFGIEVLYLGQLDYTVIFPALVAGIVAHLVCGVRPPFPALQEAFADTRQVKTILIMLACGALFGLIALLLIESLL